MPLTEVAVVGGCAFAAGGGGGADICSWDTFGLGEAFGICLPKASVYVLDSELVEAQVDAQEDIDDEDC